MCCFRLICSVYSQYFLCFLGFFLFCAMLYKPALSVRKWLEATSREKYSTCRIVAGVAGVIDVFLMLFLLLFGPHIWVLLSNGAILTYHGRYGDALLPHKEVLTIAIGSSDYWQADFFTFVIACMLLYGVWKGESVWAIPFIILKIVMIITQVLNFIHSSYDMFGVCRCVTCSLAAHMFAALTILSLQIQLLLYVLDFYEFYLYSKCLCLKASKEGIKSCNVPNCKESVCQKLERKVIDVIPKRDASESTVSFNFSMQNYVDNDTPSTSMENLNTKIRKQMQKREMLKDISEDDASEVLTEQVEIVDEENKSLVSPNNNSLALTSTSDLPDSRAGASANILYKQYESPSTNTSSDLQSANTSQEVKPTFNRYKGLYQDSSGDASKESAGSSGYLVENQPFHKKNLTRSMQDSSLDKSATTSAESSFANAVPSQQSQITPTSNAVGYSRSTNSIISSEDENQLFPFRYSRKQSPKSISQTVMPSIIECDVPFREERSVTGGGKGHLELKSVYHSQPRFKIPANKHSKHFQVAFATQEKKDRKPRHPTIPEHEGITGRGALSPIEERSEKSYSTNSQNSKPSVDKKKHRLAFVRSNGVERRPSLEQSIVSRNSERRRSGSVHSHSDDGWGKQGRVSPSMDTDRRNSKHSTRKSFSYRRAPESVRKHSLSRTPERPQRMHSTDSDKAHRSSHRRHSRDRDVDGGSRDSQYQHKRKKSRHQSASTGGKKRTRS